MSIRKSEKDANRLVKSFTKKLSMSGLGVCNMPGTMTKECRSLKTLNNIRICLSPIKYRTDD